MKRRNWMRLVLSLFLCAALVVGTAACGKHTSTPPTGTPAPSEPPEPPEVVAPELSELIDDEYATGSRGEKPNVPRFPEDEEWLQLLEKQQPIFAGESYTETFDGTYYTSRLSALSDGARFAVGTENAIDGKSLTVTTEGNYAGIRLTGMKFIAGGTYRVEMDYNVLSPSNDFFFQFRAPNVADGASDVFSVFGNVAGAGKLDHTFDLGMYDGYYIMVMPRNNAGKLVVDNIKITRLDSRPIAEELTLKGTIAVGSTVEAGYTYLDYEEDAEGKSEFRWFAALSDTGLNKMVLPNSGKTLAVTEDMRGKYIGFQVVPRSVSDTAGQNVGIPQLFMSAKTVGGTLPDYGEKFSLQRGQSFTEDFEGDVGEEKNLIYVPHGNTDNYIFREDGLLRSNVLRISSAGSYLGTDFTGMSFAPHGLYRISMDFAWLTMPNAFYVQLRGSGADQFHQIREDGQETNTVYHFEGLFEIPAFEDYFLMMFPDSSPVELLIDNLKVERLDEDGYTAEEVTIGTAKVRDDFDVTLKRQFSVRTEVNTAASCVTADPAKAIEYKSLYVVAKEHADASGVRLAGANAAPGNRYIVTFRYKVFEAEAGTGIEVGFIKKDSSEYAGVNVSYTAQGEEAFQQVVAIPEDYAAGDYILYFRMVNGSAAFAVDDIVIQRMDPNAGSTYESFEGEPFYARATTAGSVVAALSTETPAKGSGNALKVTTAEAGTGIALAPVSPFVQGQFYEVTFSYKVLSGTGGIRLKIGAFGTEKAISVDAGADDRVSVLLESAGDRLYLLTGGAFELLLDDVMIQYAPRYAGAARFDGANDGYSWDVNNASKIAVSNDVADQSPASSGAVLNVTPQGPYGGIQLRSRDISLYPSGDTFKVSFTYRILENVNASTIYVQIGGANVQIADVTEGACARVEYLITSGGGDCVMLFGGGNAEGLIFTLDDFAIEGDPSELSGTFESEDGYRYDVNNTADVAVVAVKDMPLLSGHALKVASKSGYGGCQIRKQGLTFTAGATYRIRFDYYVEAATEGAIIYVQIGGAFRQISAEAGTVLHVDLEVTAGENNPDCLMLFGSGNAEGQTMYFDNLSIAAI